MGKRYLIDSNVIIDFTANRLPQIGSDFIEQVCNTNFLISVASKIEVLGFNDVPLKLKEMEEFVNTATILQLDDPVVEKAILLRRSHKKLKLGDAIIAATANVYDLTLLTRNLSDFHGLAGLKIINPWDI